MSVGTASLEVSDKRGEQQMKNWTELGLGELDDYNFGLNGGWVPAGEGPGYERRFETPNFVATMFAVPSRVRGRETTIHFDIDEVLPDLIAAQDLVREKGYPSRSKDKETYKVWSRALTAQGKRFKQIIAQVREESPEFDQLFSGWGGCSYAHGKKRPTPVIRGLAHRVAIVNPAGGIELVWVMGGFIAKRDSYAAELDAQRRLEAGA